MALTILSLSAGLVGAAISSLAPRLVVDRFADALVADLKRARLAAQISGAPVAVAADTGGYEIAALNIVRAYPEGLVARWNGEGEFEFSVGAGLEQGAATVLLRKGRARSRVDLAPVSGRISRAR